MSYYDIDDILADAVEIPCKFNYDIPGLGYLEGNPGKQVNVNTKLQLPLWLGKILGIVGGDASDQSLQGEEDQELPFVDLLQPPFLSNQVLNSIKASAETLDVHSINANFLNIARKWIALFGDKNLASIINEMVLKRSIEINNHANNIFIDSSNGNGLEHNESAMSSQFLMTMDELEKKNYRETHASYKDTKNWMFS